MRIYFPNGKNLCIFLSVNFFHFFEILLLDPQDLCSQIFASAIVFFENFLIDTHIYDLCNRHFFK